MRRAFSLLEIMIVCSIAVVVLTVLLTLSNSNAKLNRAALSSVTLQGAMMLQETIAADLRQLGIVPGRPPVPLVAPRSVSFYRCVFDDKVIKMRPVKYGVERTPRGNYRLIRTEVTPTKTERYQLEGILTELEFSVVQDVMNGWAYLRVAMTLIDDDVPPPTAVNALTSRTTSHDVLCRIPIPSEYAHPRLRRTTQPVVERDLLPLD